MRTAYYGLYPFLINGDLPCDPGTGSGVEVGMLTGEEPLTFECNSNSSHYVLLSPSFATPTYAGTSRLALQIEDGDPTGAIVYTGDPTIALVTLNIGFVALANTTANLGIGIDVNGDVNGVVITDTTLGEQFIQNRAGEATPNDAVGVFLSSQRLVNLVSGDVIAGAVADADGAQRITNGYALSVMLLS